MNERKSTLIERPTIPPIPTPVPTRNDPENFAERADAVMAVWPANTEASNLMGLYMEQQSDLAAGAAAAADQSATDSATSADASEVSRQAAERAAAAAAAAPATPSTSTSVLTIGSGDHGVDIEQGRLWAAGQFIHIALTSDPANVSMHGVILAYDTASGSLSFRTEPGWTQGSGTFNDWTITGSGPPATLELLGVPPAVARADRLLAFDAAGAPIATAPLSLRVGFADGALSAENATNAVNAANAVRANTAGRADSAAWADGAAGADYATNAGNASNLDGLSLIELVRRTSAHLMGMGWDGSRLIFSVDNQSFGGTMPMHVTFAVSAGRAGQADNADAFRGRTDDYWLNNRDSLVRNIYENGILTALYTDIAGVGVFAWAINISDADLKRGIVPTEVDSREKIRRIPFVGYSYAEIAEGLAIDDGRFHAIGWTVQDLAGIDPEWELPKPAGSCRQPNDPAILVDVAHAVQQIDAVVEAHEAKIRERDEVIAQLLVRIEALETRQ